ncbi:glycoside hydrolase [Coniochaeta sp. 2T2.1]|nr:glycoside hydrolase [Coniochaeta sp. 2T2.1]
MKLPTLLLTTITSVSALSGKATTTRYYDGTKGACGCGPANGNSAFPWQAGIGSGIYTAAASPAIFGGSSTWCGSGCGTCFRLTSTGSAPCSGCGTGGASGQSIVVMVTNLCPHAGNERWCANAGSTNNYGYQYHFDIQATSPVLGDNPVVNFEQVACPSQALTDYKQCQCAK